MSIDVAPRDLKQQLNALYVEGQLCLGKRKFEQALVCYEKARALSPSSSEAYYNLGVAYHQMGNIGAATLSIAEAINMAPARTQYKAAYSIILSNIRLKEFRESVKKAMIISLRDPLIDHHNFCHAWFGLYQADPSLDILRALFSCSSYDSFCENMNDPSLHAIFSDPFLYEGVRKITLLTYETERGLTFLRNFLLEHTLNDDMQSDKIGREILLAVAAQGFQNEYIWCITAKEEALLERLSLSIDSDDKVKKLPWRQLETRLCVLIAYMPPLDLVALSALKLRVQKEADSSFKQIWSEAVLQPLEELEIQKQIAVFGSIEDEVSQKVQEQYEENPYPRWTNAGMFNPVSLSKRMRNLFPYLDAERFPEWETLHLLIPGCGTGRQAMQDASCLMNVKTLAVDISRSSLAYAIRKARDIKLNDITFMQADILQLSDLEQRFEVISCTGVLHHMKDPMAGWKVLADLLLPQGVMKIGLYSTLARKNVGEVQLYLKEKGYSPSLQGMREARKEVFRCMLEENRFEFLQMGRDFCTASRCRDLLFHVQEHTFTLPQIKESLKQLNLEFLGFDLMPVYLSQFRTMFPEDGCLNCLDDWYEFEKKYPDTFRGMYQFWVQKNSA